jgi:hypothetical protein
MHPSVTVDSDAAVRSRIEAQVRQLRAMMQAQQFLPALAAAQALQSEVPENRDVLYLIAVYQRYLGRGGDALTTLKRTATLTTRSAGLRPMGRRFSRASAMSPFGPSRGWSWGNGTSEVRLHDTEAFIAFLRSLKGVRVEVTTTRILVSQRPALAPPDYT